MIAGDYPSVHYLSLCHNLGKESLAKALKPYLLIGTRLTFFMYCSLLLANQLAFIAAEKNQLGILAKECLITRKTFLCEKALIQTESLQRKASSSGDYACQTTLLGLGSDIITAQKYKGFNEISSAMILREVKSICNKFE